jgi:3-Oxoacyl-[acyl-carrier-protein (ACP)] synthase III C terminal
VILFLRPRQAYPALFSEFIAASPIGSATHFDAEPAATPHFTHTPPETASESSTPGSSLTARRSRVVGAAAPIFPACFLSKPSIAVAAERCKVPIEKCHTIMEKYGYTGTACIPMTLDDAIELGKIKRRDLVVMISSGLGWNQVAAAVRVTM